MKNTLALLALLCFLGSCGGSASQEEQKAEETSSEMTTEEETVVVEQVIQEVQTDISEIKNDTEESLQEVDSLLNNL